MPQQIQRPSWGANHDGDALGEPPLLACIRLPAIDGQDPAPQMLPVTIDGISHLDRQFARWCQHQSLHPRPLQIEEL